MFENEIDVDSLWYELCIFLKEKMGEARYSMWIEVLKPLCYKNKQLMVLCPSGYIKNSINNLFSSTINSFLSDFLGEESRLLALTSDDEEYENLTKNKVGQESFLPEAEKPKKKSKGFKRLNGNDVFVSDKFTFENFIKGKNNEFAMAAAQAVSENPGNAYNPLFIYGSSGLGKTHLMKAVGHEINKNFDCNVMYLSSEKFTTDLIESLKDKRNNAESEFRKKYRNVDVLLIDDIQFIANKPTTQEEFFHTFNELYSRNKQIIISADRPPQELKSLEDRLISRFSMGLTVDIQAPDFETRMAILQDKMKLESIELTNDILEFIAMNIKSNIRELEGALINVLAYYKLKNDAPMTVEYVKGILASKLSELTKKELTIDYIKEVVANYYKIEISDLSSKNRSSSIALPRQVAMYLCRNMIDCALGNIGTAFEKDHTTIMHGVKQIDKKLKVNEDLQKDIQNIKRILLE